MTEPGDAEAVSGTPRRTHRRTVPVGATVVIVLLLGGAFLALTSRDDTRDTHVDVGSERRAASGDGVEAMLGSRGLRWCEDVPAIAAPADHYRDRPAYEPAEAPVGAVRRWAGRKPGFQGLWTDRSRHGWITVAFDRAIDERRRELRSDFPGVGAVAVDVGWTARELEVTQTRVSSALQAAGIRN